MLPLDDPRRRSFKGGYGLPYDASVVLRRLLAEGASEEVWEECYTELHHQGDVGQASYAAVPWIVEFLRRSPRLDADALGLVALIELERTEGRNPKVCDALSGGYFEAIRQLPGLLGSHPDREWDERVVQPRPGPRAALARQGVLRAGPAGGGTLVHRRVRLEVRPGVNPGLGGARDASARVSAALMVSSPCAG